MMFFLATQRHHSLTSKSWREKNSSTSGTWDQVGVWPTSANGVKPSVSDPTLAPSFPAVSLPEVVSFIMTQPHKNHIPACQAKYAISFVLLISEPKGRA